MKSDFDESIRGALGRILDTAPQAPSQRPTRKALVEVHGSSPRWLLRAAAVVLIAGLAVVAVALSTGRNEQVATSDETPAPTTLLDVAPEATAPGQPDSTTTAPSAASVPEGFVPPKEGPDDQRDPIQRFLGVPADVVRATEWSDAAQNQAIVECMAARGFDYDPETPETDGFDPTSEDDRAVVAALDGDDGCEQVANRQTHLLPNAEEEFGELDRLIRSDPRAVEASGAVQECVDRNGPSEATALPGPCTDVGAASNRVFSELSEEYAPQWIYDHREVLEALRDRIAGFIERSNSPSIDPGSRGDSFGKASVEPAIAGPGDTITITPAAPVQPVCLSPALIRNADGQRLGVLGDSGTWIAGSDDVFRLCLVDETSSPHDFVLPNPLPAELPNGAYSICLTQDFTDEGCGPLFINGGTSTDYNPDGPIVPLGVTPPSNVSAVGVAVGDQVMLGAADELVEAGYIVDAMLSRSPTEQLKTIETLIANPNAAQAASQSVVIHVGNNGPIDPVTLDMTMTALDGSERVIVITSNVDGDGAEFDFINANNELLRALPEKFPNVHVIDWAELADDCPGVCFADDKLHLQDAGKRYYIALITAAQLP